MKIDYLMRDGKYSIRVRKALRAHLKAQESGNAYINDLIQKDLKIAQNIEVLEELEKAE